MRVGRLSVKGRAPCAERDCHRPGTAIRAGAFWCWQHVPGKIHRRACPSPDRLGEDDLPRCRVCWVPLTPRQVAEGDHVCETLTILDFAGRRSA